jgi:hypothetical protein
VGGAAPGWFRGAGSRGGRATATELLALGPGFGDPLLAALHLADFTAPVGPGTYLEVLAPTTPDHSVARWLSRVGGSSGWVLSVQVPSLDGVKERAAATGSRRPAAALSFGHRTIRLVPARSGRTGIVAVDVHATDREHGTGVSGELCNTLIRFV